MLFELWAHADWPKELHVVLGCRSLQWEGIIFEKMAPVVKYRNLLLWTWVDQRKHRFNRICQVAPMCPTRRFRELCNKCLAVAEMSDLSKLHGHMGELGLRLTQCRLD